MSSNPDKEKLAQLAAKWRKGTITAEEKAQFNSWYNSFDDTELILKEEDNRAALGKKINEKIKDKLLLPKRRNTGLIYSVLAAATLILISGTLVYLSLNTSLSPRKKVARQIAADIKPGGNKATLTLANGRKISLTDSSNGEIAEQSGIAITKTADGQLVYTIKNSSAAASANQTTEFNTIETPVGGQYQINLPDGTKVWLNAASSLKYPAQFAAHQRKVELTGEGYFEVSKDKKRPFTVVTGKQEVQVLGTHFNVNAYPEEKATKTTLLEGIVKVSNASSQEHGDSKLLRPGEQSTLTQASFQVEKVDIENAVAWKNGYFTFADEDLEVSMRKLSRWYNVEISYSGKFDTISFGGAISRSKSLAEVLQILELTRKIKFKIEGRRIILMS
ncbi:FecR family protein [Pedobacter cryoconitis]|uniref:FecR family protein n=1 Tax=Pedobacter cryoconitis TaxID=188932 RepID=A0A327T769_9SPHI|nr:FecR family protein [Pedobacter cryoconitis]RAJ37179.1 FecR family protein [Pedobacter cryoconitis]